MMNMMGCRAEFMILSFSMCHKCANKHISSQFQKSKFKLLLAAALKKQQQQPHVIMAKLIKEVIIIQTRSSHV